MKKLTLFFAILFAQVFPSYAKDISADEAMKMYTGDAVFLDIRSPSEYSAGHIEGAVLINFDERTMRGELSKLDKSKKYVLYCRSGRRSAIAENTMKELGITDTYNIKGGIQRWSAAGYPLVK